MADPRVSILFPLYNGARHVRGALDSLLAQTFTDFEIEIINDGSTDDSAEIVRDYRDPRIRFSEQANAGISVTLNRLLERARGVYLARQDHDDWSRPDRLARQVAHLDAHPETALVGSWVEVMDDAGVTLFVSRHPVTAPGIREELLFTNPIAHGSVMMRRVPELSYRAEFDDAEDLDLWERLATRYALANLPVCLYRWRTSPSGISVARRDRQRAIAQRVHDRYRRWYHQHSGGTPATAAELAAERDATGTRAVARRKLMLARLLMSQGAIGAAVRPLADLARLPFVR